MNMGPWSAFSAVEYDKLGGGARRREAEREAGKEAGREGEKEVGRELESVVETEAKRVAERA